MRLIDADALRAQVEAAKYPLKTEMLSMIDAASTVEMPAWHDVHIDPPKKSGAYMGYVKKDVQEYYGLYLYVNQQWISASLNIVVHDLEYWADLPDPPEVKE